jgi:hypothetical protein
MITELISSWTTANYNGRDMYIVNTASGNTVWVPKSKFDTNAEQISYKTLKAGEKYTKSDGTEGTLQKDRNEYVGAGKQVVKKYDSKELMEFLVSKNITPTFSLS